MTEISSENIMLVAFFLGSLFWLMFYTCHLSKSKSSNETDETSSQSVDISQNKTTSNQASQIDSKKAENLKIVEGIGPKIEALLHDAGITSMRNLANTETEVIKQILADAGSRYRMHNPKTWSNQAQLIFDERWDELKEYQDVLNGGKDS